MLLQIGRPGSQRIVAAETHPYMRSDQLLNFHTNMIVYKVFHLILCRLLPLPSRFRPRGLRLFSFISAYVLCLRIGYCANAVLCAARDFVSMFLVISKSYVTFMTMCPHSANTRD